MLKSHESLCVAIIIISREFFTTALSDGLVLGSEWPHVFLGHQDSSQYFGRSFQGTVSYGTSYFYYFYDSFQHDFPFCKILHQDFTKALGWEKAMIIYIYSIKFLSNRLISLVGRVLANNPGDQVSIPSQVIPKSLKWYLIPTCLTLIIIRYVSRVKRRNPGKGFTPSPTPRCSSDWKESLLVAFDYGLYLYLLTELKYFAVFFGYFNQLHW